MIILDIGMCCTCLVSSENVRYTEWSYTNYSPCSYTTFIVGEWLKALEEQVGRIGSYLEVLSSIYNCHINDIACYDSILMDYIW